jgi:uncharacterized protein YoaH (UPF0181 family)
MASPVKINIPGVGLIEATNAASEDTLLKILEATKKSESTKKKEEKEAEKQRKQIDETTDSLKGWQKGLIGNSSKASKLMDEHVASGNAANASVNKLAAGASMAAGAIGQELLQMIGSLAQSAASLTSAFMTSYDQMAENPISAGLTVLQTEVDATATMYKTAATALLTGIGAIFGPIGMLVGAGIGELVGTLIGGAAEIQKQYNQKMADEMQKSVKVQGEYTKMGASFAGGMMEMRNVANDAGISMSLLSKAASKSAADLTATGLSHGEAIKVMADGMKGLAKTTGKSGASLRDEMLSLGYSYEEQGEVMASYMAQQRSAGINLKNLAPEELARGAREYATNLKVISDITGEDAKKLMEKAKAESLQAGVFSEVMRKGGPEAVKKLQNQLATMPEGLKKAYIEKLSLGKVVDAASNIYMNANEKAADQLTNMSDDLYNAGVSAADATRRTGEYSEQTGKYALEHADKMAEIGKASIAGVVGPAKDTSDLANKITMDAIKRQEGATDASVDAAKKQAELAGKAESVEAGFAKVTSATQDFAKNMEQLTGKELGTYAKNLADGFSTAKDAIQDFAKTIDSVHSSIASKAPNAREIGSAVKSGGSSFLDFLGKVGSAYSESPGLAEGGWANGDPAGFLQKLHGTELVIPTSGGMLDTSSKGFSELIKAMTGTDLPSGNISDTISKGFSELAKSGDDLASSTLNNDQLLKKIDDLISVIGEKFNSTSTNSAGDIITNAFNGMTDILTKQLGFHEEIADHAKDNKDLLDKLLKVSM